MEHWKTIKGHPNYAVSDSGKVKNISTGEQRKPVKIKNGYLTIAFADCGKHTLEYLHRLVANEFAPNPHGFTVVNHKDRNKENCCASNLEWCTTKYNVQYSVAKTIGRYDMEGNFIDSFSSVRDAEQIFGYTHGGIDKCANGVYKHSHGYKWRYLDRLISKTEAGT